MKLLVAIALVLAPAAPSVSARAFCMGGVFNDVAITASYTAGAHDKFVTVTATTNGLKEVLGRQVFVRRHTTYTVTADTGQHDAPNGVRVHWSGFSTQRSLPWSVVWRTPSIACR